MSSEPTDRFAQLVTAPDPPLDELALLIAAHAELRGRRRDDGRSDPVADGLRLLDELAAQVPRPELRDLLQTLFVRLGFRGDERTYDDPRNSYLNHVLRRRQGIPITLSVVVMEVGRRLGLEVHGISTPGHFLTRVDAASAGPTYIDAFDRGRLLDEDGVRRLLAPRFPGLLLEPHLQPVPTVAVIDRMLRNLVAAFARTDDRFGLRWATELRTLLPDASPQDRRAFALAMASAGEFARAARLLDRIADDDQPDDADDLRSMAARVRARLN